MTAATVDTVLRVGRGFPADEHAGIRGRLGRLDARLATFTAEQIELELSVKDRDRPEQRTVLQADIVGFPRLVATSTRADLDAALIEVRDDLIRQLTDMKSRSEPRNNRQLRGT
jgi:ribosome-associated translation inhibitor RaiA